MQPGIDTIIRKYLMSEADEDELASLNFWLDSAPENRIILRKMQNIWKEKSQERKMMNQDEIFEQKIWKKRSRISHYGKQERLKRDINYLLKSAAVILILLIPSFYLGFRFIKDHNKASEPVLKAIIIKESPCGQKLRTFLPDGSSVWLNSESCIKYEENFNDSIRLVELQGEGYFEVMKNPEVPFVVKSGDLITTALGTSFNIRAYPEDNQIEVSLTAGKAKVAPFLNTVEGIYIEPNEGAAYDRGKKELSQFRFSSMDFLAWKEGILIFNNDNFKAVLEKLRRWYGIDITVTGRPPHDWNLTGKFTNNNLVETLDAIRFSRQFEYKLDNKNVEIFF